MSKKKPRERLYDGLYRRPPQSSCATVTFVFAAAMVTLAVLIAVGFIYYGDAFKALLTKHRQPISTQTQPNTTRQ
jgi:hypothetical protein